MSVLVKSTVAATGYAVDAQQEPTSPPTATNADPSKAPKMLSEPFSGSTGPTREQAGAAEGVPTATKKKPSAAAAAGRTSGADGLTAEGVGATPEEAARRLSS